MRKFKTDWYDKTLSQFIGGWERNAANEAEIGIEIEVEGHNLPRNNLTGWVLHEDGSLRGESAEYVFRNPIARTAVPDRLRILQQGFENANSEINQSYRTSVHVHMNVRNFLIKHIYNNIMLYIIFEDILAEMAGKDRVGNLFCLRAKDAEFFLEVLRNAIVTDDLRGLSSDNLRYSAVNPAAMWRHGSLEFRSFRGTTDMILIQQWVDVLCAIRDAAQRYNNPIEIVTDLSAKGPRQFVESIFGTALMPLFGQGFEDKVYAGVQLIQHAAYAHDWSPVVQSPEAAKKRASKSYSTTVGNLEFVLPPPGRNLGEGQWQIAQPQPDMPQRAPRRPNAQQVPRAPIHDDAWIDNVREEEL